MSEKVVIFTKPGCPYCQAAKEDFNRRGISFEERNVKADPAALEEMVKLSGARRVPVILQGEEVTVGFGGT